jgi:predicted acylesterase/phospholipase RssA
MRLKKGAKIAILPRAGPSNGPDSAQYLATLRQGFQLNKLDVNIAGIYAVSGSCPTALLGCIGEEEELCNIWLNLTPKDIVGDEKEELDHFIQFLSGSWKTKLQRIMSAKERKAYISVIRRLKNGHVFSNLYLARLIRERCGPYLDRIFSPEAAIIKIGAVDYLTGQQIIFSNRIPEHRELIHIGVAASMGIVPLFNSFTIDRPMEFKLTDKTHPKFNSLLLVDGGYRASLLLEEAIREPIGYDIIVVIDINGLNYRPIESEKYNLVSRIEWVQSIASTTNDRLQLSLKERIDEGIAIRNELMSLEKLSNSPQEINKLIGRMDHGRLRLFDKHAPEVVMVSGSGRNIQFDFTNFTRADIAQIMRYGHNDALRTLRQLGLSTKGLPLIRPA